MLRQDDYRRSVRNFSGQGRNMEKGTWKNISSIAHLRLATLGKMLEFFLLVTLKTGFEMRNLSHMWKQSGHFFPNQGLFFKFSKKGMGGLVPFLLVARL